jgi:hypothetical protein
MARHMGEHAGRDHPKLPVDLTLSQVILVLSITLAVFTAALAVANIVDPVAQDARPFAVRCARVAVASAVVAIVCGVIQLRRRRIAAMSATGDHGLRIRFVVLGCIAGIVAVGGIFAWFDRGGDGILFIFLGIVLVPFMLVWKASHFHWRW